MPAAEDSGGPLMERGCEEGAGGVRKALLRQGWPKAMGAEVWGEGLILEEGIFVPLKGTGVVLYLPSQRRQKADTGLC